MAIFKALAPVHVERKILLLRGERVMIDADLAALYGVTTSALVQAVKRNPARFPSDFMFQLTPEEHAVLRSQTVISKAGRGGRRTAAYASTKEPAEQLYLLARGPRSGSDRFGGRHVVDRRFVESGHLRA
jgi:hypothetical protein